MSNHPKQTPVADNSADSSIIRSMDDLISIVDKNYRYVAVSRGYTQLFGLDFEQIIGKTVVELHGEEVFRNKIKPALDKTLAGEEYRLQFWRPNACGEMRFIDSQHTVYRGPLTEGPGVAVVARDITELALAQAALEDERTLLKTIIDAIPDFIFAKDPKGVYQLANNSFASFLGLTTEQIIGQTDHELMSEGSAEYITKRDQEIRDQLKPQNYDEWVTYKDGRRRLLEMHKLPLPQKEEDQHGVLGIGRNVTHEREAEQKLLMAALFYEASSDPCLIFNSTGEFISCNPAARTRLQAELPDGSSRPLFKDLFYYPGEDIQNLATLFAGHNSWHGALCSVNNQSFFVDISRVSGAGLDVANYLVILRDQDAHKQSADELHNKAYSDPLTGLPNRLMFFSRLESALIRAERQQR